MHTYTVHVHVLSHIHVLVVYPYLTSVYTSIIMCTCINVYTCILVLCQQTGSSLDVNTRASSTSTHLRLTAESFEREREEIMTEGKGRSMALITEVSCD